MTYLMYFHTNFDHTMYGLWDTTCWKLGDSYLTFKCHLRSKVLIYHYQTTFEKIGKHYKTAKLYPFQNFKNDLYSDSIASIFCLFISTCSLVHSYRIRIFIFVFPHNYVCLCVCHNFKLSSMLLIPCVDHLATIHSGHLIRLHRVRTNCTMIICIYNYYLLYFIAIK